MNSLNSETEKNRLKMIEDMLSTNPNDSFLKYAAALEHKKLGHLSTAIDLLENLRKEDAQYLGTYYQLGKLYEEDNKSEKAIAVYRSGREIAETKNDVKAIGELSEALMILDDDWEG